MIFSIKSRAFKRELTFTCPGNYYIFIDFNGKPGTLGNQICDGGHFMGNTISYSGNDDYEFEKICRRWFKSFLKNTSWEREMEIY